MNKVPSPETMHAAELYGFWLTQINILADQKKASAYDRAWKEAVLAMVARIAINLETKG